jgi:DNA-binding LacI/PurR family transcriptional regulator
MNIKEFARTIGVSPTTVSNALSGKGRLSSATREMVHSKMKELGYSPNATARALVTGRTYRLGIVLSRPEGFGSQDTYFSEILAGILRRATYHDYNLLLHSAHYPDWQTLLREIRSGSADGVLLIARYTSDELTPAILDSKVPSVCISYCVAHPNCYSVDCDNVHGSYLATRHLLKLGHRRLALLYPGDSISWDANDTTGRFSLCPNLDCLPKRSANMSGRRPVLPPASGRSRR